ncbi:MAG: insulinase family protein [Deltaproteobacteria bacterium]|nr:insulinase family protein [Deltaproteobacteria bacterium]
MNNKPIVQCDKVGPAVLLTLPETSLPVVHFTLALRHGAFVDPQGQAGRTRMMIESLLRGTQKQNRREFHCALECLGSQIDTTVTSELILLHGTSLKRNLSATFNLLSDAVLIPAFDEQECKILSRELIDALRLERESDEALAYHFWRRALYQDHPLARRPTGEPSEIAWLKADDLRSAYKAQWNANSLIAALSGDINKLEAQQLLEPIIAKLNAKHYHQQQITNLPEPDGLNIFIVDKPYRSQVQMCVGRSAVSGFADDVLNFWLGIVAFGGTFTAKFCREVRDIRGWSYTAYAEFARKLPFKSPLILHSAPAITDAVDCLELELQLYRELANGQIENQEIEAARSYLLCRYPLEIATISDLVLPAIRDEILNLPPNEFLKLPKRLSVIEPEAVSKALQLYLHPDNLIVVLVATADAILPDLQKRFTNAEITIVNYLDGFQ